MPPKSISDLFVQEMRKDEQKQLRPTLKQDNNDVGFFTNTQWNTSRQQSKMNKRNLKQLQKENSPKVGQFLKLPKNNIEEIS